MPRSVLCFLFIILFFAAFDRPRYRVQQNALPKKKKKKLNPPSSFYFLEITSNNECNRLHGGCHSQASCRDVNGTRMCVCNNGYHGDGINNCTGKYKKELDFKERNVHVIVASNHSGFIS